MTRFLLVALVLLGASAPAASSPSPDAAARAHFEQAQRDFAAGRYDEALEALEAAVALDPVPAYFFNIATVHEWKGDFLTARAAMEGFLRRATTEEGRARALAAIDRYKEKSQVARVSWRVGEPGARLYMDDALVGQSPIAGLSEVPPGHHVFRAELPGHEPWRREVTLVGGQLATLDVALVVSPTGVLKLSVDAPGARVAVDGRLVGQAPLVHEATLPPGHHEVRVERPDAYPWVGTVEIPAWDSAVVLVGDRDLREVEGPSPWPWVVVGAGAVAGAVALGFTLEAASIRAEYDDDRLPDGTYLTKTEAERVRDEALANDHAATGAVLWSVGGALVVGGLVAWWLELDGREEPALELWGGPDGAAVRGRF